MLAKFDIGDVNATLGALEALEKSGHDVDDFLDRHVMGDWGELVDFDRIQNEEALEFGGRLLSIYRLRDGTELWVVTTEDRTTTTLLLPAESDPTE